MAAMVRPPTQCRWKAGATRPRLFALAFALGLAHASALFLDGTLTAAHAQRADSWFGRSSPAQAAQQPSMADTDGRYAREQAEAARLYGDAQKSIDRGHFQDARNRLELLLLRYPESHLIEVARRDLRTVYEKLASQLAAPTLPQGGPSSPPMAATVNPPATIEPRPQVSDGYAPVRQPEDQRSFTSRPDYPRPSPGELATRPGIQANPTAKAIDFLRDEFRNSAGDRVFFTDGSADFGTRARVGLEAQANWLKRNPGVSVVVEGHADDGGNRDFNNDLSRRRAEAVKAKLVDLGVEPSRIEVLALGRDKPVTDCKSPACANQNRLVLTTINRVTLATSR